MHERPTPADGRDVSMRAAPFSVNRRAKMGVESGTPSVSQVPVPRQQDGDPIAVTLVISEFRPKTRVRTRGRLGYQSGAPHHLADVREVKLQADHETGSWGVRRPDVDQLPGERGRGRLHNRAARDVPHRYDEL